MNMQRRIITFGLTEAQNALVEQSRPAGNYEVFDTDAPTDVIAIGAVAIIVMPNEPNTSIAFGGEELTFKDSEDKIRLEYIYRANPKNGLPQITSIQ